MRLRLASFATGLSLVAFALPLSAQLRATRPPRPTANLPRLMVANPYSFSSSDSAASVRVGAGLREKVDGIADRWYTTITRVQMNEALQQYGYPPDAVLPVFVARQLASQLQARALVTSTLTRGEGGRVSVEARLTGISDQTGHMVRVTQAQNQSFEDFGSKIADSLKGAFNALDDAKECERLRATDPKKATDAALKALKSQPNDGLAEWCLANIGVAAKAPDTEIINHLRNATRGDSLSLEVWTLLANRYDTKGDTTNLVSTFQQMLRVAPTNAKLREDIFKRLIAMQRPEAGEQVAREGLKYDPQNADLLDLLSSACLVQEKPEKNKCAIDALEQMYAIDSTKADTLFYTKITFAASREPVDTARFLKWAQQGYAKYPKNGILLGQLVAAYGVAGPVDSLVSTTKRLLEVDTTDVTPVLKAMRALAAQKRFKEAVELGGMAERYADASAKQNLGVILAQDIGLQVLQTQPVDFPLVADIGRSAAKLVPPGRAAELANYILGVGLYGQISTLDQAVVASKSCDDVGKLETLLGEARTALSTGQAISPDFSKKALDAITSYDPRIAQMKKAYCK